MKLFLDTASVQAVQQWVSTGLIDGVTTNPTHLSKEGGDPRAKILEICSILPDGDISVEVTEKDPKAVYKQAREIAALAANVLVKIPCHVQYYPVIKQLADEGIRLNITLLFTLPQALLMSKLGVDYISLLVGRWEDSDVAGTGLLEEVRAMLDTYGYETELLAASIRSVRHVHDAIFAGADAITVPVDILEKSANNLLTDKGIELFDRDWQKLGVKHFP